MEKVKLFNKQVYSKLFKETFWAIITKGTAFVIFFLTNIYLARKLNVELFGEWSYFYSILTLIFTICFFGINTSSKVFVAKYNGTFNLRNIFYSSIRLRFVVSILLVLILFLLSGNIAGILQKESFKILLLYSMPYIFLKTLIEFLKELFQGLHRIKYYFYITLLELGLNFILVYVFLNLFLDLKNIIYSFTVSGSLTVIVGFALLIKFYRKCRPVNEKNSYDIEIFKYALPLILISMGFITVTEIDTVMLGYMTTSKEVGYYAIAKNIINKLPHLALAISIGVMPIFSQLNNDNMNHMKRKFKKVLSINIKIYFPLVLLIIFISPFFIPLIYGNQYDNSILPLQILSIWLFIVSFNVFFNSILDFQYKAGKRAINFLVTIILNILLNLILIPLYGSVGAAIGTTVSYIPYVILNWFEVRKLFNLKTVS